MLLQIKEAIYKGREILADSFVRDVYRWIKFNSLYFVLQKKIGWKKISNIQVDDFKNITYMDLEAILQVKGREVYEVVLGKAIQSNLERIRRRKIKLAFLLYDSSMWVGDELYWLLDADERFEVEIVLSLRQDQKATPLLLENHKRGVELFRRKGIHVTEDRHEKYGDKIEPDILIWCDPGNETRTHKYRYANIPLTKLMVFFPYGIFVARGPSLKIRYNMVLTHFAWLAFADTRYFQEAIGKYSDAGNSRLYYSGYPKMDAMYSTDSAPSFSWKICSKDAKKIIWSPHWSINQTVKFATFLSNYRFFYEYAKTHPTTTSWVVKPHPNLLFSSVCEGGFSNAEEAKEYFEAWDRLPNAKLVLGGDYSDLFKTSDAMINDSASFMSEYQYVHKPMLFLERDGEAFNDYGYRVKGILYKTRGDDFAGIEAFINDVVIGGKDIMKEEREAFFKKELDYKTANGCLASTYIYKKIVYEIFGQE